MCRESAYDNTKEGSAFENAKRGYAFKNTNRGSYFENFNIVILICTSYTLFGNYKQITRYP